MDLQEIIQQDWWYLKDKTYMMDKNWLNEYKEPAQYPAFKWWNQYTFRTPRYYFRVVIREHTEEKMNQEHKTEIGKSLYKKKYTVIISGAESEIPLPIEFWEYNKNPWTSGTSPYINSYYFGEKYKDYETEYVGLQTGTYTTLINGFNDLSEAKEFLEMWKKKIIDDHKQEIKIDEKIIEFINGHQI